MTLLFEIFIGTVLNYQCHVSLALFDCLIDNPLAQVLQQSSEKRAVIQGLFYGNSECVTLVDGTKQYFFDGKTGICKNRD